MAVSAAVQALKQQQLGQTPSMDLAQYVQQQQDAYEKVMQIHQIYPTWEQVRL